MAQLLFLKFYNIIRESIGYGSWYTTHLSVPSKIMSEYYKIIEKIEDILICQYCIHSSPYILFQQLLPKLGSQAHFNAMCFLFAMNLSAVKGVEKSKSKIKNGISKK